MAAPETFSVEAVIGISDPWIGKDGLEYRTDEVKFVGEARTWLVGRPVADPHTEAGATLTGWKNPDGTFGLARVQKPSENRSNGASDPYDRRPDHPINTARALHTSAMSTAVELVEQMINFQIVERPAQGDESGYLDLILRTANWVRNTYPEDVQKRARGEI